MSDQYWHMGGTAGLFMRATLRTLQFIFAIIVAATYGVDLHHSTNTHTHGNSAWVYAEVVACLSILTCMVHCFVTVKRVAWCAWDWVLFFLWVSQFGVFGTIYIGGKNVVEEDFTQSVTRMKVSVWIDFVNMLLWFATAVGGIVWCCTARRVTRLTDRLDLGEEATAGFAHYPSSLADKVDEKVMERKNESFDGSIESTVKGDDEDSMKSESNRRMEN
jgi:hypothetical protein